MKKIKVMLLIPSLWMGGAENIVINIASNIDRERFDVILVSLFSEERCVDKYKEIIKRENIEAIFLNKKDGMDIKTLFQLIKIVRKERPEVIHTHLYACIYGIIPAYFGRIKINVHTIHNLAQNELPQLYQKIMKVMYKCKRVIPVSINESVGESIRERYGVSLNKIPLVKNGVDITRFEKKRAGISENEEKKIINVGRMSPQKNHFLLIQSFEEIIRRYSNVRLVLVGDGELRNEIQDLVIQKGLEKNVDFVGNVGNVEHYLQEADIFVMSSDYEGLPLSVIEAMASGLPIVTTKAGGICDLVKEGVNGLLSEIGDKNGLTENVLKLLQDSKQCNLMGEKSRELAQEYSVGNMVANYERIYAGEWK